MKGNAALKGALKGAMKGALNLTLIGVLAGGLGSLSFTSLAVYAQDSAQHGEEQEGGELGQDDGGSGEMYHADNLYEGDSEPADTGGEVEEADIDDAQAEADDMAAAETDYDVDPDAYEFKRAEPEPLPEDTAAPQLAASQDSTKLSNADPSAQNSQAQSAKEIRRELEKARQAVEEARQVAEQIVADAQQQANLIRQDTVVNDAPTDLGPVEVQTHRVAVEIASGTVEEIATAIMPVDWRVMVDVKDQAVLQRRFQYVSTKSRDQALRDLLGPVGLRHQYFFDLKDAQGVKSPLLVISKR